MTWTNVPKPTQQAWTETPKPSESSVLGFGGPVGEPIGLLLALTYAGEVASVTSGWTEITKPTIASWTSVPKPTT